jgi:cell division protein FtsB
MPSSLRGSIVSLYRRYLYLFGYYQTHGNKSTNARMHYLLREDLRQLDTYIEDTKLLGRENIHTNAELSSFEKSCLQKIDELVRERTELKREIRKMAGTDNPYTTKDNPKYQDINSKLKVLRKELRQVVRIRKRSNTLLSRIGRIEKDEEKKLLKLKTVSKSAKEVNSGRNRASDRPNNAPDFIR